MHLPSLTDPGGLFDYLILLILGTALLAGVVLLLGLGPY